MPKNNSRIVTEAKRIPQFVPPCILFPYQKMGQSASGIDCDLSDGKFGPFKKQLFVGDQTHSTVMRVFLEKINGRCQGAQVACAALCACRLVTRATLTFRPELS